LLGALFFLLGALLFLCAFLRGPLASFFARRNHIAVVVTPPQPLRFTILVVALP
jgi:hypothetical protein